MSENTNIPTLAEREQISMLGETLLWVAMKNGSLGIRFEKKATFHEYEIGFFNRELNLAIEIDRSSDYDPVQKEVNQIRDNNLHDLGITVLRIDDQEIKRSLNSVLRFIKHKIEYLKKQEKAAS